MFDWTTANCDSLMYKGNDGCALRGVAKGTVLQVFTPDGYDVSMARKDVNDAVTYYLNGRNPRLSLAAARSDGSLVLLFTIDERPGLVFPGGTSAGAGPGPNGIWFLTLPSDPTRIAKYGLQYAGAPPLEFLRYDEHFRGLAFTVLGTTDDFRSVEQSYHDKIDGERKVR